MVTQKFQPRTYKVSDLDKIGELMATHFEKSEVPNRKLIFDWIACHCPGTNGVNRYLVVEDKDVIVAYEGRMTVDLMINGQKEKGYFFHDTLVHPEYRKKGLGLALVNAIKSNWEKATDTFAVGIWMNEFTHEILRRRGYLEINANYFVKPIRLESSLKKVVKNSTVARFLALPAGGLIKAYDFLLGQHRYHDSHVFRISRFDLRFDEFARRISEKFNLIVLRHSAYLNWKYVDKPFADYTIYAIEKNNELTGYVVLQLTMVGDIKVGLIVDILADPDDSRSINILCEQAIKQFKKEKVDYISCVLTNKKFIRLFKRHLFIARQKTAPVMLGNLHKHSKQELISNIDNWYLTYGDSDECMW